MAVRVCVMRIEGTNREDDAEAAFEAAGAEVELVHLKQLIAHPDVPARMRRSLDDYHILMFPGGFSAGDAVRSGAIWAARIRSALAGDLVRFIEGGRPVLGICNGFQVLVELGVLPGLAGTLPDAPQAALMVNEIGRFQCRPVEIRRANRGRCIWTQQVPDENLLVPIAHGEGRFTLPPDQTEHMLTAMEDQDQIVFRYVKPDGAPAGGEWPYNPNGSIADIAGICNPRGNVLGMMPHPEDVVDPHTTPDWTRRPRRAYGLELFRSAVEYVGAGIRGQG